MIKRVSGISLIGILILVAAVVAAALLTTILVGQARRASRDESRLSSLMSLADLLRQYRLATGELPCGTERPVLPVGWYSDSRSSLFLNGADDAGDDCPDGHWAVGANAGLLTRRLISELPADPVNDRAHQWWYFTNNSRNQFVLVGNLDANDEAEASDGGLCRDLYEIGDTSWWAANPFQNLVVPGDTPCCLMTDTCS